MYDWEEFWKGVWEFCKSNPGLAAMLFFSGYLVGAIVLR
tara:strand:- start:758 stop:874 length:117 start_codon:yes stop_codon:yes gene_type:complete